MSVLIAFTLTSVAADCTRIYFRDTSNYNTTYDPADVTVALLSIMVPDGTTYTIDLQPLIIASDFDYTITATDIGGSSGDNIADGVYEINYALVNPTASIDAIIYQTHLQTCALDCCIASKILNINDLCCDDCIGDTTVTYTKLLDLYDGMMFNFDCGNYTEVQTLLTYMQRICTITDLNCSSC